jgi:hypothetical protein
MVEYPGSYSDESLTIDEVNNWLENFWKYEAGGIIDACENDDK